MKKPRPGTKSVLKQTRPIFDPNTAGARLRRKIEITRRLSEINMKLRYETGDERNELRQEQEALQEEYKGLEA